MNNKPLYRKKKLLNLFKCEINERIQKITNGLLALSNNEGKEALEGISREAHTLKGSSRMLGLFDIGNIAHKIENLLVALKEGKLEFNESLSDVICDSLESIRILTEDKLLDKKSEVDVEAICDRIEKAGGLTKQAEKIEKAPKRKDIDKTKTDTVKKSKTLSMPEIGDTVRVDISKLDKLVNLAGELETSRLKFEEERKKLTRVSKTLNKKINQWEEIREKILSLKRPNEFFINLEKDIADYNEINEQMDDIAGFAEQFGSDVAQMSIYSRELHSLAMELRLLPLSVIFNLFPYAAGQLAREYGKEISLKISGETTELDKKIIDGTKDPLLHLVRNAIAHGIESVKERAVLGKPKKGRIELNAYQEGSCVCIEVIDDGKGIDPGKIKENAVKAGFLSKEEAGNLKEQEIISLIFKPGFSTAAEISGISGRGVGLDVVKNNVENLGGEVKVKSDIGKGTKITLQLPLTLATTNALLIELNGQTYAVPNSAVDTAIRIAPDKLEVKRNKTTIILNKKVVPVYRLKEILQMNKDHEMYSRKIPIVVINYAQYKAGFIVDEIIENQEIVIKELGRYLSRIKYFSGATILPKGDMAFILHVPYIMDLAKKHRVSLKSKVKEKKSASILVVEDAVTARELEKQILEAEGYKTDVADDGLDALDKINTGNYDLIISDIMMPQMDGLQMVRELKSSEKHKNIPVVIISALGKEEDRKRGMEAGASAYFSKVGFDQSILLDTIQRLIKK